MPIPLNIREIDIFKYESEEFAFIFIYISGLDKKNYEIYVFINLKLYLVNRLKANILIGNNVLYMKDFAINLSNIFLFIYSYFIKIVINTRHHFKFLRQRVLAYSPILILP